MELNDRQKNILELTREHRFISVKKLSKQLFASDSTIRRDLTLMENEGYLTKAHGGAYYGKAENSKVPFELRTLEKSGVKDRIARAAAAMIQEADFIYLDSSSTCARIIPHLKRKKTLTVVTNGLRAIMELKQYRKLQIYSTGGYINATAESLVGMDALQMVKAFRFNKLFMATECVDLRYGVFDSDRDHVALWQQLIRQSDSVVLLVYAQKFQRTPRYKVCDFEQIDYLITDYQIPDGYISSKKVIVVDE